MEKSDSDSYQKSNQVPHKSWCLAPSPPTRCAKKVVGTLINKRPTIELQLGHIIRISKEPEYENSHSNKSLKQWKSTKPTCSGSPGRTQWLSFTKMARNYQDKGVSYLQRLLEFYLSNKSAKDVDMMFPRVSMMPKNLSPSPCSGI